MSQEHQSLYSLRSKHTQSERNGIKYTGCFMVKSFLQTTVYIKPNQKPIAGT